MNKFIQQGKVKVIEASILNPVNSGLKLIVNFCGQNGKFDGALEKGLTKKWSRVREDYKTGYAVQSNFKPGALVESAVSSDIWVVNLIVRNKEDKPDSGAITLAIKNLAKMAKAERASVHMLSTDLDLMTELRGLVDDMLVGEGVNLYLYAQ